MPTARRLQALNMRWATMVYWTGKVTGVLVAEPTNASTADRYEFTAVSDRWWQAVKTRAWNAACMTAVVYRIWTETLPITQAAHLPQASCYDTVCEGVWCVYACVYYAVAWLDRTSEAIALAVAVTWRRWSTVDCLNVAAADAECNLNENEDDEESVSWHEYLTVAFPIIQFTVAANAISLARSNPWHVAAATVAAVASCAPVAAHGTLAALLIVANNSMRSINRRLARLLFLRHQTARRPLRQWYSIHTYVEDDNDDNQWQQEQLATVVHLANRHWRTAKLVTGSRGVCDTYGVDLMIAVLLAAVRVTYVAISVFRSLTDDMGSEENARTNMSLAAIMQLIAWFGQFAYLAYICDELTTQSYKMVDNLNSLLMDIFKECRLSGETCSSKMQEIETVQEFIRQIIAHKVIVHAYDGLITLNLSLITTIIGVTLTYFIVLLQFESSHSSIHNNTIEVQ